MKKIGKILLLVGLILVSMLVFTGKASALPTVTPPVPEIPTIPLVPELLNPAGNSGLVDATNQHTNPITGLRESVNFRYIQVTPNKYSQRGAVWLNDPISFDKDVFILLYVYMQAGGSGDGMAIALKERVTDSDKHGVNWEGSLGVYGATEYLGSILESIETAKNGALKNSFVVELDNYKNPIFDDQAAVRSHIAYSYPGLTSSYIRDSSNNFGTREGLLNYRWKNKLNHYGLNNVTNAVGGLANGYWVPFFLQYNLARNELFYQYGGESNPLVGIYQGTVTNFINGNTTSKEKFSSRKLYLGFLGATGKDDGAVQEMGVRIYEIPNALNLSVRQLVYTDDNSSPFFDTDKLKEGTSAGPEISLTKPNSFFRFVNIVTYGSNSAYSSMGTTTFKIAKQPSVNYDLNSFKWSAGEITVVDDQKNNQILITTKSAFSRGEVATLEYQGYPDFPGLRSGLSTVVPNVQVNGSIYGEAMLPKNKNNVLLRFNINENLELDASGTVSRIEGDKQTVIYDTNRQANSVPVFDQPNANLALKTKFALKAESSYASLKASLLYVSLNDALDINYDSFKVNGQAIPRNRVSIDESGQVDIEGEFEITKSKALEIEYQAKLVGYAVNRNVEQEFLLSTYFELSSGVGDVVFEAEVAVKFQTSPKIQFKQASDFQNLATAANNIFSVKKDRSIAGSDTDLNSTNLHYFIKDLGPNLPAKEYQPEGDLEVAFNHQNRQTLDNGAAQDFLLDLATLTKGTDEVRYYGIFAKDNEGNLSNVVYLKAILASDKLTLDRVPNLMFENSQALSINNLIQANRADKRIFPLKIFEVENKIQSFDGFEENEGQIILRDSRLDRSKRWTLSVKIDDIKSVQTQKSLNSRAGVTLQLGFNNQIKKYVLNSKYHESSVNLSSSQGEVTVEKNAVLLQSDGTNSGLPDVRTLVLDPANTHLQILGNSQAGYFDQGVYQKGPYQMDIRYILKIED